MAIANALRTIVRASPEDPSTSLSNPESWLSSLFGGGKEAGVQVTEKKSVGIPAVMQANNIISGVVGQLPKKVYQKTGNDRQELREHPAYKLLQREPNGYMTPFIFFKTMQTHNNLWGNAYAEIKRDTSTMRPTSLNPVEPWRVHPVLRGGKDLVYNIQLDNGSKRQVEDKDMIHVMSLTYDGLQGISPIMEARGAVANAIATQDFSNKFYENGAHFNGFLSTDQSLSDDDFARVKESWDQARVGIDNAHGTPLLEGGLSYNTVGIPPNDAQYIETKAHNTRDIARIFNLPPHLVGDLENANYSSLTQQDLHLLKYSMNPHFKTWEQELGKKLLREDEKKDETYIEMSVEGLLRADPETRIKFYKGLSQLGAISSNEIREKENMPRVSDGDEPHPIQQDPTGNTQENSEIDTDE